MIVEEWIDKARVLGASDLHLETNTPLVARVRGELQTAGAVVPGDRVVQAGQELLGAEGWALFKERGSADVAVSIRGVRCRASFFQTVSPVLARNALVVQFARDDLQGLAIECKVIALDADLVDRSRSALRTGRRRDDERSAQNNRNEDVTKYRSTHELHDLTI